MEDNEISEEGKRRIEELRNKHVIDEDELRIYKEQCLLSKMYECQDEMAGLLDQGENDIDYYVMQKLIERLEKFIQDNQDLT
tara:strand:+ start:369 stop:614 length:246 start_codon:yes stop_codon:yes gene_type:complete